MSFKRQGSESSDPCLPCANYEINKTKLRLFYAHLKLLFYSK